MPFTEDLTVFFQPGDFAHAAALDGVTVNGIFEDEYVSALGVESTGPVFVLRTVDAGAAQHGSTLIVDGVTWSVVGVRPDGTGVTTLQLRASA